MIARTTLAPLLLAAATFGCGSRQAPAQCQTTCSPAPIERCAAESARSVSDVLASTDIAGNEAAVRGRVAQGSVICEHGGACDRCKGSLILVEEGAKGFVILRGERMACRGMREEQLCCGVDAMGKNVVARGTLHRDVRSTWIETSVLCSAE